MRKAVDKLNIPVLLMRVFGAQQTACFGKCSFLPRDVHSAVCPRLSASKQLNLRLLCMHVSRCVVGDFGQKQDGLILQTYVGILIDNFQPGIMISVLWQDTVLFVRLFAKRISQNVMGEFL